MCVSVVMLPRVQVSAVLSRDYNIAMCRLSGIAIGLRLRHAFTVISAEIRRSHNSEYVHDLLTKYVYKHTL